MEPLRISALVLAMAVGASCSCGGDWIPVDGGGGHYGHDYGHHHHYGHFGSPPPPPYHHTTTSFNALDRPFVPSQPLRFGNPELHFGFAPMIPTRPPYGGFDRSLLTVAVAQPLLRDAIRDDDGLLRQKYEYAAAATVLQPYAATVPLAPEQYQQLEQLAPEQYRQLEQYEQLEQLVPPPPPPAAPEGYLPEGLAAVGLRKRNAPKR